MILRYSATHKTEHNKVYRLDAIDAYNQKLVKKIAVRGITVKGLAGTNAYLYLESIKIATTKPPEARAEMEIQQKSGIKRVHARCCGRTTTFTTSRTAWSSTRASSSPTSTRSRTRSASPTASCSEPARPPAT